MDDQATTRWNEALGPPVHGPRAGDVLDDLVRRHGEPHRRYHTLDHVLAVLDALDELGVGTGENARALRLAAWFHDAVYDPARSDNEAASATVARGALVLLGVPRAVVHETARLIELTATHAPEADDDAGATLIDADLSILGSAPEDYDRYAVAVRVEYEAVPDEAWRRGRADVLRSFLQRAQLFHTELARSRWEDAARVNLSRELATLGSTGQPDGCAPDTPAGTAPGPV